MIVYFTAEEAEGRPLAVRVKDVSAIRAEQEGPAVWLLLNNSRMFYLTLDYDTAVQRVFGNDD